MPCSNRRREAPWAWALLLAGAAVPVSSMAGAQVVRQAERYGDWSLYVDTAPAKQLCFAASQPANSEPKNASRNGTYVYISAWPKDGVKTEISVKLGYNGKKGGAVTATIGPDAFKLFIKDDRAFIAEAANEAKLLDAMKKGTRMVVLATSEKGLVTSDVYSLSGLSQALQALATVCK